MLADAVVDLSSAGGRCGLGRLARELEASLEAVKTRLAELTMAVERPIEGVVGDSQELTQAVLNLIFNAIDAIPEGRPGHVEVRARTVGDDAQIEVEDDGGGMDAETVQRCVDLFFSTKPEGEGTGLGLGIVQHIVVDHGGTLDIDSEPDRGTRVRIRLPRGIEG